MIVFYTGLLKRSFTVKLYISITVLHAINAAQKITGHQLMPSKINANR